MIPSLGISRSSIRWFWQKPDNDHDQPCYNQSEYAPKQPAANAGKGITFGPRRLFQHVFGAKGGDDFVR